MKLWPWLCLSSLFLVGGCAVGPNFKAPEANAPALYRGADGAIPLGTNSLGDLAWWELFRDPALQELVRTALTNNYDLRIAATRVEQAQALLAEARAGYFPQIGYQAGVGGGQNTANAALSKNGSWRGTELLGNVSWEIDLWGRIRRLNEAGRAQYLASEEARRNVMISLIANVAQAYFQLLALDTDLVVAQDTTNSLAQSLVLFNQRLAGGVSSKLESASATAALATAAATIPELRRQMVIQENQIRVLLGFNPGPVARRPGALQEETLPIVPPGLPSELLQRRPDIRESLELVRSANAQVGVATANFFPRLTLTGLLGEASPELLPLTAGTFGGWSVAAGLAGPLFQGGALKGQLQQARAQWQGTVLQYQATVLNAFQEVANALVSQRELAQERVEQARAVVAYQQAVEVANQRYRGGQASYYELLLQQQLLFPAQNSFTQTVLNQLLATVQLYKALGGGWNVSTPSVQSASK